LITIGADFVDWILFFAAFLTEANAPGLVSIGIVLMLLAMLGWLLTRSSTQLRALNWLNKEITNAEDAEALATIADTEITRKANQKRRDRTFGAVATAWCEFRETLLFDDSVQTPVLRNSVRPSAFFNVDDLQCGPGFFRYVPGLFVTVGLLFTFLGLIAALQAIAGIGDDVATLGQGLDALLGAVSAKFIMSLSGLASSIVFTLALRRRTYLVEHAVQTVCDQLEKRLSFISLEQLAFEQLKVARSQKESFQEVGTELVAELGRSLQQQLPESIASSIQNVMAPMLDGVGRAGADGVGQMVSDLSTRLSGDIDKALSTSAAQLSAAGDKMGLLVDRMDQSAGAMGQEMEGSLGKLAQAAEALTAQLGQAAERTDGTLNAGAERLLAIMNETLEGIRRNTAEGAEALREAANDMRSSAGSFRSELDAAAQSGSAAFTARIDTVGNTVEQSMKAASGQLVETITESGTELLTASSSFRERMQDELLAPLTALSAQLGVLADRVREGGGQIVTASGALRGSSDATQEAAKALTSASREVRTTQAQMHDSINRIDGAVSSLASSTGQASEIVTRSAREIALSAERVLETAKTALSGEQQALQATLQQLSTVIEQLTRQQAQLADIDERLGKAFREYGEHVQAALGQLSEHARNMTNELAPALDTLREVVDQAEKFIPEQRR